jgi:hypothetical protein
MEPKGFLNDPEIRKFLLALVFIAGFFAIVAYWTGHSPALPGDVVGGIVGGYLVVLGALANHFFKALKDPNKSQ